MGRIMVRVTAWVRVWLTGLCLLLVGMPAAQAHEVQPTIADFTQEGEGLSVAIRMNAEALLSGINLDGLSDTDDAIDPSLYENLRALSDQDLAARIPQLVPAWNAVPVFQSEAGPLALRLDTVSVEAQPNAELPRFTLVTLSAPLADGAETVTVTWPEGSGALIVRQQGVENPYTGYLDLGATSPAIPLAGGEPVSGWQSFASYIPVGFDHILPKGLDHILFVLGLFLLSTRMAPLLWQVTSFTLAHTVTLALGALGWVNVPGSIVEPLIAASIVYVAIENIFARGLNPWRPFIIFGFGLLHGLGFASVLQEFGLPSGQFIPALIGFNVGVEIGQLTVIAIAAIALWGATFAARLAQLEGEEAVVEDYEIMFRAISIIGSLMIAAIGIFWVIERTLL